MKMMLGVFAAEAVKFARTNNETTKNAVRENFRITRLIVAGKIRVSKLWVG
jgi:hypothetical protein